MIQWWDAQFGGSGGGGGTSTDPGIENVRTGIGYTINDNDLVGTLSPIEVFVDEALLAGQELDSTISGPDTESTLAGAELIGELEEVCD